MCSHFLSSLMILVSYEVYYFRLFFYCKILSVARDISIQSSHFLLNDLK
jgi:hypothetical protein